MTFTALKDIMPKFSKDEVLAAINIEAEVEALLGPKVGGRRRCFNKAAHSHGDNNPSLSMSPKGIYKCHACGRKGDFFQLYMDVNGIEQARFGETLLHFARKYNVDPTTGVTFTRGASKVARKIIGKRLAKSRTFIPRKDLLRKPGEYVRKHLLAHYGITARTAERYGLGWATNGTRLLIPIPVGRIFDEGVESSASSNAQVLELVNVRAHDIMKYHCSWHKDGENSRAKPDSVRRDPSTGEWFFDGWKPAWDIRGGKVIGVRGYNTTYLYPIEALANEGDIFLVGGELKALLMNQLGFNAVSFTCGEGSYAKDLIPMFIGRTVRILYDIDEAGNKGADKVGKVLANAGANVLVGRIPVDGMPTNGDITDYLRANKWNIECLDAIEWKPVNREIETVDDKEKERSFTSKPFSSLTDGAMVGQPISVNCLVAGVSNSPFAVPMVVDFSCPEGRRNQMGKCSDCTLPGYGFEHKKKLTDEQILDLIGRGKRAVPSALNDFTGIPTKCFTRRAKVSWGAAYKLVVVPPVGHGTDTAEMFRHHSMFYISKRGQLRENQAYEFGGTVLPEPKDNRFSFAAVKAKPIDGDVFNYTFDQDMHERLYEALWTDRNTVSELIWGLVADMRDHVLLKVGRDTMIMVEMMSLFMPFSFWVGKHYCHKVCPEVMVLGDSRVGKSSMASDLISHYSAGRYADCASFATFVGMVGGNHSVGGDSVFSWGLLPTSDGGFVTLDEYNKLDLSVIGGLTNLKSAGIAERNTAAGFRKARARVRFLELCNPRGGKVISQFGSPLEAAVAIVGSPQDLARVDFLYVARTIQDNTIFNKRLVSSVPHRYTKAIARYHIKWAWSLTEDTIKFADQDYLLMKSIELVDVLGGNTPLLSPTEVKFKLGRTAIALASLAYSISDDRLGVTVLNEHIDLAFALFAKVYGEHIKSASVTAGIMPTKLRAMFDDVSDYRLLRILTSSDDWSREDLAQIFGPNAGRFMYIAQLELSLIGRRRGGRFYPRDESFKDVVTEYISMRAAQAKKRKALEAHEEDA